MSDVTRKPGPLAARYKWVLLHFDRYCAYPDYGRIIAAAETREALLSIAPDDRLVVPRPSGHPRLGLLDGTPVHLEGQLHTLAMENNENTGRPRAVARLTAQLQAVQGPDVNVRLTSTVVSRQRRFRYAVCRARGLDKVLTVLGPTSKAAERAIAALGSSGEADSVR